MSYSLSPFYHTYHAFTAQGVFGGAPESLRAALARARTKLSGMTIGSGWLIGLLAFYFGFVLNLAFWRFILDRLEITNGDMLVFAVSLPILIFIFFAGLFSVLLVSFAGKPIVVFLLLISSAANFAMFRFGIFIDSDMLRNVFETDAREAGELMTATGLAWIALTGVLPAIAFAFVKVRYLPLKKEAAARFVFFIVGALILGGFATSSTKEYAAFFRQHNAARKLVNTFNIAQSTFAYFRERALARRDFAWLDRNAKFEPQSKQALSARPGTRKRVMIFIVGETARAKSFSLGGYERETNPLLSRRGVVYFKNMRSCGTATAVSLPCMFSNKDRREFKVDDARFTQNLLDTLKIAGYDVLWRENNSGCKGVCKRVPTEKTDPPTESGQKYSFDEALLEGLEARLKETEKNTAIFLHTIGSHGPAYYRRTPERFRRFTPTCDTADLQNCTREAIRNTYDNTILYTDTVVASAIDIARKFPELETTVIYVSDHGESLGENRVYLHGLPYAVAPNEQTQIPFVVWMSETLKKNERISETCVRNKAEAESFSHDNIFHSVLSLLSVRTRLYRQEKDIFSGCRPKSFPTRDERARDAEA
jgi:lipid A ethanolaminephosphotransferase